MLTYEEIMKTDLSQLTTAADKWDAMAGEFKKLEDRYKNQVQNVSLDGTWTGQASLYSRPNFATTHNQYVAAQTEAKAVASLLREAHTQFVDLKAKVVSAREDAIKAGMKVSDTGTATFDFSKVSASAANAMRHDPDFHDVESSWSQHIAQAVSAMDEADQWMKTALDAVGADANPLDGTPNGFNAKANGNVEYYEAEAMVQLANKINDGKKLTPQELAKAEELFRDHANNKVFTQTLLQELGPDGAMKFTRHVDDWALSDKDHKSDYAAIERGFADSLATATTVPGKVADMPPGSEKYKAWLDSADGKFYKDWMAGMQDTGTHNYGDNLRPLHGYQILTTLMQKADVPYDDQYLNAMGDQMIAAERADKSKSLFDTWGADYKGITPDPIDALMGVMSKNPDASTFFFDPADKDGADHLKYLVGSGHDARHWPSHFVSGGYATEHLDLPNPRAGLGSALEAAATGHPPLGVNQDPYPVPGHTQAQARVMDAIIKNLDGGTSTTVQADLRDPVAKALAEYTPDTHAILSGSGGGYFDHRVDGSWTDANGKAHLATLPKELVQVMRGLSDDPNAYSDLNKTELRYIDQQLHQIPQGATGFDRSVPLSHAGSVLGTYTAIREDVLNDTRVSEYSKADWKAKMAYHFIGGALTPLYLTAGETTIAVGDSLQRGVDTITYEWDNAMRAKADSKANEDIANSFMNADTQMHTIVGTWGNERYDTKTPEGQEKVDGLFNEIMGGHTAGLTMARGYLTDTTN
ncbi:hypothetical protein ACGFRG_27865 [Streptomyces sp. NPDC048696]|uniref:hypothetical protein n=1 Tax=Streptomyces sp. NPDC048696 TaxID=3365585 RepID=UPI00371ABBB3